MKHFITLWTVVMMCMSILSSCEKGYDDPTEEPLVKHLIMVNGVEYKTTTTHLSTQSGLNFEAKTANDELTVNLVMKDSELNKEYDLNSSTNCGSQYLQVLFSNAGMDSYSVATMGPNSLNVLKDWGTSEIRELKSATAKICNHPDGTYSVYITAEGNGLSFIMDFIDKVDRVD